MPLTVYRGGTSRGLLFHSKDLPDDKEERDRCFLALLGSPDVRQIDGMGGATSHTSKVAVVSPSDEQDADVDYLFGQVAVAEPLVDYSGMCGNLVAAVGYFAVDEGLLEAVEPATPVRVYNVNTQKRFCIHVPVSGGETMTRGEYSIDGVAGKGAFVKVDFLMPAGSISGSLYPTGRSRDELSVAGLGVVEVTVVDVTNPIVFLRAEDLGLQGTELPAQMNADSNLMESLEAIRASVSCLCGWAESPEEAARVASARPRIAVVSPPADYTTLSGGSVARLSTDLCSRVISMQKTHQSYAVTAAIALGVAARLKGSLVRECVSGESPSSSEGTATLRVGHPSGVIEVETEIQAFPSGPEPVEVLRGSVGRTARLLMKGSGCVPFPMEG
jgi:2-methylaconitate cis-trans-isomerase PrpF